MSGWSGSGSSLNPRRFWALLFGFQAETILARSLLVVLIAVPLLIQSYGIFAIAYAMARLLKLLVGEAIEALKGRARC